MEWLKAGDYLVVSGSTPALINDDIYGEILKSLMGRGVNVTVDATKGLLLKALPYHPFLIKPNKRELEEFFDVTLYNKKDIIEYAEKLKDRGARNILVSLGADGAVVLAEDGQLYERKAPEGKVINSVGSGDSMVAGFIAGYMKHADYDEALKLGCGYLYCPFRCYISITDWYQDTGCTCNSPDICHGIPGICTRPGTRNSLMRNLYPDGINRTSGI